MAAREEIVAFYENLKETERRNEAKKVRDSQRSREERDHEKIVGNENEEVNEETGETGTNDRKIAENQRVRETENETEKEIENGAGKTIGKKRVTGIEVEENQSKRGQENGILEETVNGAECKLREKTAIGTGRKGNERMKEKDNEIEKEKGNGVEENIGEKTAVGIDDPRSREKENELEKEIGNKVKKSGENRRARDDNALKENSVVEERANIEENASVTDNSIGNKNGTEEETEMIIEQKGKKLKRKIAQGVTGKGKTEEKAGPSKDNVGTQKKKRNRRTELALLVEKINYNV